MHYTGMHNPIINSESVKTVRTTLSIGFKYISMNVSLGTIIQSRKEIQQIDVCAQFIGLWELKMNSPLIIKCLLRLFIIKPVWTNGIQIWGSTAKIKYGIIQRLQNKIMRMILRAPWYLQNDQIYSDLRIPIVEEMTKRLTENYELRLHRHPNVEAIRLLVVN